MSVPAETSGRSQPVPQDKEAWESFGRRQGQLQGTVKVAADKVSDAGITLDDSPGEINTGQQAVKFIGM